MVSKRVAGLGVVLTATVVAVVMTSMGPIPFVDNWGETGMLTVLPADDVPRGVSPASADHPAIADYERLQAKLRGAKPETGGDGFLRGRELVEAERRLDALPESGRDEHGFTYVKYDSTVYRVVLLYQTD